MAADALSWLEHWVAEHLRTPEYHANPSQMTGDVLACRAAGEEAGYTAAALDAAAGGDLAAYLWRAQERVSDAAMRGLVAREND